MSRRGTAVAPELPVAEQRKLARSEQGFHGGLTTVSEWARVHLRGASVPQASSTRIVHPSSRRAAWLLTTPSERLNLPERRYVEAVCTASPALAAVHELAMKFRRMLDAHGPNALDSAECSEIRSLGASFRRDRDAVLAAIQFQME